MLTQPSNSNNSDLCYENPQILANTGTRVGDSYVPVNVASGSSVSIRSTYQHIESQNACGYLPYECSAQAECRVFGFGPDYGHHYGF
ncbi:hypothetical protein PRIPAC_94640 [Pristionchus pacificus]|uniref:Uncharacterized protein n=1 Tax=Pristionchus pacificus TaxID=54126 RepID=A0A454XLL7_PRIPA|nr:hypothetical protein PRIPAC_94640 [Pristionchus pacificus]|eukprot:PDM76351.1 hypothetical protein PRIPAC_39955 [Pristionchus pacificus]